MFNLHAAAFSVLFGALLLLPLRRTRPQSALPVPVISVGKGSLSGFGIANNMRRFFQEGKPRTKKTGNDDDKSFIGDEVKESVNRLANPFPLHLIGLRSRSL